MAFASIWRAAAQVSFRQNSRILRLVLDEVLDTYLHVGQIIEVICLILNSLKRGGLRSLSEILRLFDESLGHDSFPGFEPHGFLR